MENWDTDSTDVCPLGKIFGSRGRGFTPVTKDNFDLPKLGRSHESHEEDNGKENENEEVLFEKTKGKNNQNFKFRRNRDPLKQSDINKEAKPKSKYIPEDPSEDDNEIFGNSISSGINFDKYDNFEVTISGENTPAPITTFESSGLKPSVVDVIKKCNYSKPTPIQKYAIPSIMNGRDLMGCAQTGSGKTAAFLIPIINILLEFEPKELESTICQPQAVIISPTRELTIQIFNEARKFSRGSYLKVALIYGGTSIFHQLKTIESDCHILVATPGRLLDFVKRGKIAFFQIKFLVLDEADRMLDMGFLPEMQKLISHKSMKPSGDRQTLMFSATFPEEIQRLAKTFLTNYIFLAIGIIGGACLDIQQKFFSLTKFEKRNKLVELLEENKNSKCLVFVEQKRTTDFLATFLSEKNLPATSIHGDREQREREEALKDFKSGKMNILVATSVAARGLDIKNVVHVINFDLPSSVDEYVHRIGRTGRVGNCGMATSFFDPLRDAHLAPHLIRILKQAGQDIPTFLEVGDNEEANFISESTFGGQDYRNQDMGFAVESTFEEEVW